MNSDKKVKRIFIVRILLWIVAGIATIIWIRYSFHLFSIGVYDVHEYASLFRPVFGKCLLVSVLAVLCSFSLRSISDRIRKQEENEKQD